MDWSFQDFTNADFTDRDAADFNGQTIIGSCFYRENLDPNPAVVEFDVFPPDMTGVTFKRCNLDNVKIPAGNTVEGDCCNRRICVQADLEDWITDNAGVPLTPVGARRFDEAVLSKAPENIPVVPTEMPVTVMAKKQIGSN